MQISWMASGSEIEQANIGPLAVAQADGYTMMEADGSRENPLPR